MRQVALKTHAIYRPDIDGLRCIAVLLVVAYHLFPGAIRGGFVGVDIFFVISGYLISSILIEDMRTGRFSILTFYARRIRRIFPALIVVLASTYAAGWFILSPEEFASLGQTVFGGASFSANLILLHQIGYFDIAAENKPLLHLWSLGVEEQFYIVWPLVLFIAYKRRLNLLTLVWLILLGSFILNVARVHGRPDQTFYLPFTRAWELAAGASLVFWRDFQSAPLVLRAGARIDAFLAATIWDAEQAVKQKNTFSEVRSILGLVLILVSAFSLTSRTPFPGFAALLPVAGSALLISAENALFNRVVLSSYGFVLIGLISYPLYLWHYPLIAFTRLVGDEPPGHLARLIIAAASILLAWLTYVIIEKPIRFGRFTYTKIAFLCTAMALLGGLGLFTSWNGGFESRLPEAIRQYLSANTGEETSAHWRRGSCLLLPDQDAASFGAECSSETQRPLVVLWGDSYAAALYPGLKHLQETIKFGIAELTASACPPALGFVHPERPYCKGINDAVAQKIDMLKPDIVVLHSTWMYDPTTLEAGLQQTVTKLSDWGIRRIVLLGPVPSWSGRNLPQNLVDYYMRDSSHPLLPARTQFRLLPTQELNDRMKAIAARLNIEFISAMDELCDEKGCLARVGDQPGDLSAFDTGHLTIPGSIFLATAIRSKLFPN